jgi:hypothetical protein
MRRLSLLLVLLALPAMGQGVLYRAGGGQCGLNMTCTAESFVATGGTGPVYSVSSQLACAVDLGPGAYDCVGTDGSGYVKFHDSAVIDVGSTRIQSSQVVVTGGAITCDAACEIRDSANGTLPINTTGGIVFNGTSAMTGFVFVAVTIDIGNITTHACLDVAATVAGVEANDGVFVTRNFASTANYSVSDAYVTNAGTDQVTFRACNGTAGDINPASGSYLFWVVRKA